MFGRIFVPLDGSQGAERAIPVAARIARTGGGSIVFVHVVLPPVEFGTYSAQRTTPLNSGALARREAGAASYLAGITKMYAKDLTDLDTELDVYTGATSPEMYSTARFDEGDLIVLCSHAGDSLKQWCFGSAAQEPACHSPAPVLVLTKQAEALSATDALHPARILVPLDGSALAESALLPAAQLIAALAAPLQGIGKYVRHYALAHHWNPHIFAAIRGPVQGELHLVRVVDLSSGSGNKKSLAPMTSIMQEEARQQTEHEAERYMESVTKRCEMAFAASNTHVTSSIVLSPDVAGTIIKEAEPASAGAPSTGYDMIAMSTRGQGGLQRLGMGSVATSVLGTSKVSLLIVQPQQ
jgi:nucleotide-binding universal stress UspA family protein